MKVRAAVVAVALFAIASPAAAQTAPSPGENASDNRAVAEMLFFTGRGLMEAKRYREACVKFAESYRLDPAAGTLLNLAVCHEQEGKIASAWGEFRQSLADAKRMKREDREQLAQERIAAIEPELPFLTLVVPPNARVAGLDVRRNGVRINSAAWDTELPVDPGTVTIVTSAPGYKPRTQTIAVERKQHATLTIVPLDPAPVDASALPYWTPRKRVGALLLGVGVAGVGVGTWAGVTAINDRKDSDNQCPVFDGERRCTTGGVDAMSKAKTASWISDIAFGVGAASLLVGGYLFFSGGSSEKPPAPAAASITWRVVASPGGAQGFVTGSF